MINREAIQRRSVSSGNLPAMECLHHNHREVVQAFVVRRPGAGPAEVHAERALLHRITECPRSSGEKSRTNDWRGAPTRDAKACAMKRVMTERIVISILRILDWLTLGTDAHYVPQGATADSRTPTWPTTRSRLAEAAPNPKRVSFLGKQPRKYKESPTGSFSRNQALAWGKRWMKAV